MSGNSSAARLYFWELRHLRRDATLWLLLALLTPLVLFAVANGISRWRGQQALTAQALAEANVNPVAKPPFALSALNVGQSDLYPSVGRLQVNLPGFINFRTNDYENPERILIGPFDAAFVVIQILPLLLIALTYNLLSAERERGTLPFLLLQRTSPASVGVARTVVSVVVVLGLATLLMLAAAGAGGALTLTKVDAGRLAGWLAVAGAHGLFWAGLALWVASRGASSAVNAVALAGAWLVMVAVLPAVIGVAVKAVYPVPSRMEFLMAQREAGEESRNRRAELLAAYYEDHPELAPKSEQATAQANQAAIMAVNLMEQEKRLAPVRARFAEQLARQQGLVERLKYLSPALMAQSAFNDLSGTGFARHRAFLSQAEAHGEAVRAFGQAQVDAAKKAGEPPPRGRLVGPPFQYREEPHTGVLLRVLPPLLVLLVAGLVIGGAGAVALRRYPVAG